jgi:hypothetical protein
MDKVQEVSIFCTQSSESFRFNLQLVNSAVDQFFFPFGMANGNRNYADNADLCKIWSFRSGDYEKFRLLECGSLWMLLEPTFRKKVSPLSSRQKESAS